MSNGSGSNEAQGLEQSPPENISHIQNNSSLGLVLQCILKNTGHSNINGEGSECRRLKKLWDQLFVQQDGVLHRLYKDLPSSNSGKKQLVVSKVTQG